MIAQISFDRGSYVVSSISVWVRIKTYLMHAHSCEYARALKNSRKLFSFFCVQWNRETVHAPTSSRPFSARPHCASDRSALCCAIPYCRSHRPHTISFAPKIVRHTPACLQLSHLFDQSRERDNLHRIHIKYLIPATEWLGTAKFSDVTTTPQTGSQYLPFTVKVSTSRVQRTLPSLRIVQ